MPYIRRSDDRLSLMVQVEILLLQSAALVYVHIGGLSPTSDAAAAVVLIAATIIILIVTIVQVYQFVAAILRPLWKRMAQWCRPDSDPLYGPLGDGPSSVSPSATPPQRPKRRDKKEKQSQQQHQRESYHGAGSASASPETTVISGRPGNGVGVIASSSSSQSSPVSGLSSLLRRSGSGSMTRNGNNNVTTTGNGGMGNGLLGIGLMPKSPSLNSVDGNDPNGAVVVSSSATQSSIHRLFASSFASNNNNNNNNNNQHINGDSLHSSLITSVQSSLVSSHRSHSDHDSSDDYE
jgi:hypothetical protein